MPQREVLYQETARASKGNAFCWLTWEPQINWRGTTLTMAEVERHNDHRKYIERQRAGGTDPLRINGLGAKTALDPARFAVSAWTKRA